MKLNAERVPESNQIKFVENVDHVQDWHVLRKVVFLFDFVVSIVTFLKDKEPERSNLKAHFSLYWIQ